MLGGHVSAATRIGIVGGGRGQEDEVSPALAHPRQERTRAVQGGEHVAVEHRAPPCGVTLRDTVYADSTSGVVDQRIHGATLQDVGSHLLHLGLIGQVRRPVLAANLLGEGLQTLATPGHGDDLPPPFGEESGSCLPNSGRGSSNNDATRNAHGDTVISQATHRHAPTHT